MGTKLEHDVSSYTIVFYSTHLTLSPKVVAILIFNSEKLWRLVRVLHAFKYLWKIHFEPKNIDTMLFYQTLYVQISFYEVPYPLYCNWISFKFKKSRNRTL